MKTKKSIFRLEHPSKGTRKESILTDEMLVAFCESRIEWLEEDIRDAFTETEAFHQKNKESHADGFIRYSRDHCFSV